MNSRAACSRNPERVSPRVFARESSSFRARSGNVMLILFAFPDSFARSTGTRAHTPPEESGFRRWNFFRPRFRIGTIDPGTVGTGTL